MINFGSLITAMVTPFKEDDINRIDYIAAENIITHLVKTGSDSIIISGTTGERPTLTHQEEEDFLDFTLKKVNVKIISFFAVITSFSTIHYHFLIFI